MANLPIPDETTWIKYDSQTGTGPFSFTFSVFAKADLRVKVGDTELAQNGFTFTGTPIDSGYDGGSIELVTPAAAQDVLIWREVTPARASDFAPASSVSILSIDAALDRLTAHAQDARRDLDRAVKVALDADTPADTNYDDMIADAADAVGAAAVAVVTAEGVTQAAAVEAAGDVQVGRQLLLTLSTRAEAEAATIDPLADAVRTSGYATAGDHGGALYRRVVSEPAHTAKFADDSGAWFELAERTITPEMFGAAGVDGTDDTVAINAAVAYAVANQLRLLFPATIYQISDWIDVPVGNRFSLAGAAMTNIRQTTRGKGFLRFANENTWGFTVENFRLIMGDGATSCAATSDQEHVVLLGGTGTTGYGYYDGRISNIRNLNGNRGVSLPDTPGSATIGLWSSKVERVFMESLSIGSAVRIQGMAGGYPNLMIDWIYDIATKRLEPTIDIANISVLKITNVERNRAGESVTNTPHLMSLTSCRGYEVSGVRVENEYYKGTITGSALIRLSNSNGRVENFCWEAPTEFNLTTYLAIVSIFNNATVRLDNNFDNFYVAKINSSATASFTSGTLRMVDVSSAGGSPQTAIMGKNFRITDYEGSAFVDSRAAGIRALVEFPFMQKVLVKQSGVTGTIAYVAMTDHAGEGTAYIVRGRRTLIGFRVRSSVAIAGSTLQILAYKNGSSIGTGAYSTTMAIGETAKEFNADLIYQAGGVGTEHQFTDGDTLAFRLNCTGVSSTSDLIVEALLV